MSNSNPASSVDAFPPAPCRLGLGCVTFGREIDRAASFALIDHAVRHRITFLDTASAYGAGASETILGEWIAAHGARSDLTLATKVLPPYSPAAIEASVVESRRRLGVETLDLLFLHRWHPTAEDPSVLAALEALVARGHVRSVAASNYTSEQLERTLQLQASVGTAPFTALQNIHNLAVRSIDAATQAVCARGRVDIITYSPLGAGFLTGKHEAGVQPGTRFALVPGHQDIYFNDLARRRLARLLSVAARAGLPAPHLALAWALHQPYVARVLVGGRTPAHLDQALRARDFNAPGLFRELAED